MLLDTLRDGVADGEFVIDDVELTALSVLGMCNWAYQWFRPGGARSAADVAQPFLSTLLSGIAGPARPDSLPAPDSAAAPAATR